MPNSDISQRDIDQLNKQVEWDMETIRMILPMSLMSARSRFGIAAKCRYQIACSIKLNCSQRRVPRKIIVKTHGFSDDGQGIVPKAYHGR